MTIKKDIKELKNRINGLRTCLFMTLIGLGIILVLISFLTNVKLDNIDKINWDLRNRVNTLESQSLTEQGWVEECYEYNTTYEYYFSKINKSDEIGFTVKANDDWKKPTLEAENLVYLGEINKTICTKTILVKTG